ncbi:MAG: hypothetical protein WD688_10325 [Candidatus Binatia bacterium]
MRILSGWSATATARLGRTSENGKSTNVRRLADSLDRIKTPHAFIGSANQELSIERRADHLGIAAKGSGDVRLVESGLLPREDKDKGGTTRTIYYAKAGRSETVARLDLELVPTTSNGNVFVLSFRGAPLPKTSVTVFGPPKWEKPIETDEQGRITVPSPWSGRYVLEVVHFEEKSGETGREKFDRTRHIATLSFVNTKGQPWRVKP